ncbi:hypothetical protein FGE05_26855 [Pseudomonas sp. ICMP22404]|nr:hypothetical protein FGE05_26855 [Pseudomonas sp. ICMP22404]
MALPLRHACCLNWDAGRPAVFDGRRGRPRWQTSKHHCGPCGSEPARESGGTSNIVVTDRPLSRAGSLPQGGGGVHESVFT